MYPLLLQLKGIPQESTRPVKNLSKTQFHYSDARVGIAATIFARTNRPYRHQQQMKFAMLGPAASSKCWRCVMKQEHKLVHCNGAVASLYREIEFFLAEVVRLICPSLSRAQPSASKVAHLYFLECRFINGECSFGGVYVYLVFIRMPSDRQLP